MKKTKKGFTLVELVIVVAVMAILVAVAIPTVASITGSAQDSVDKTNAKTIESMIKLAEANSAGASEDATKIAESLANAGLGITSGTFYYDPATGNCTTSGSADIKITFSATAVTVQKGSAAAVTKNYGSAS